MDGEVSKGGGPSLRPLAPTPLPIPLLYDLFYEHGLAASTLPWEPAWCGLPAAPSGIGNFKSGADPGGWWGSKGWGLWGPRDAWYLPVPLLYPRCQVPRSTGPQSWEIVGLLES